MAGVRQFDGEAVLGRITEVFWARGYDGTSLDDLVAATGVKRQSLYNAFGDKQAMYLLALEHYGRTVGAPIRAALKDEDPRQGIAAFLDAHVARLADPGCPPGCLMANACTELGGRVDALGLSVATYSAGSEVVVLDALRFWQQAGRITADRDSRPLARFLVSLVRGMAATHKATGSVDTARDAALVGLGALDGWIMPPRPRDD